MIAKNKCVTVIVGVHQNAKNQPTYSGCRTIRYSTGVTNLSPCCGWPRTWRQTCHQTEQIEVIDDERRYETQSPQPKAKPA